MFIFDLCALWEETYAIYNLYLRKNILEGNMCFLLWGLFEQHQDRFLHNLGGHGFLIKWLLSLQLYTSCITDCMQQIPPKL